MGCSLVWLIYVVYRHLWEDTTSDLEALVSAESSPTHLSNIDATYPVFSAESVLTYEKS